MSSHHTLMLALELAPDLAQRHAPVLAFLFNPDAAAPDAYPVHEYFDHQFNPEFRPQLAYAHFPPGAWQSQFWRADNGQAGVSLTLPGQHLTAVFQEHVHLLDWLASLANADGCIGMVRPEDGGADAGVMTLYVKGRRLYIGETGMAGAFAFNEKSAD